MIVSFMKRSGPSAAKRRDERARTFLPVVLALVGFVTPNSDGLADLKLPPKPRGDPPMRIVRVTSSDPACQPNCPEWISAEGRIMPGSAKAFDKAIADLKGRRLPILISSHGGSLGDAMVMGFIIREKGLAVAVARTLIANCSERAPSCQNAKGEAAAAGASCASACPLVLAGGVERLVGPLPLVGVHEVTTLIKEVEGSEHLATVKKVYEQGPEDAAVHGYLTAMGIGEPVMALLRKTPAASIRWLSLGEIRQSRLATLALDAAQPIVTSGANGLNGHAFEGDPPAPDVVKARVRGAARHIGRRARRRARTDARLPARRKRRRSGACDARRECDEAGRCAGRWLDVEVDGGRRGANAMEGLRISAGARGDTARPLVRLAAGWRARRLSTRQLGGRRRGARGSGHVCASRDGRADRPR